jgi:hypothetical protein
MAKNIRSASGFFIAGIPFVKNPGLSFLHLRLKWCTLILMKCGQSSVFRVAYNDGRLKMILSVQLIQKLFCNTFLTPLCIKRCWMFIVFITRQIKIKHLIVTSLQATLRFRTQLKFNIPPQIIEYKSVVELSLFWE